MSIIEAIILGIIQGLTEFLPVSSSGHLEIGKAILGVNITEDLGFTVMVHFATVLSTITVFFSEIRKLLAGLFKFSWNEETKYISKLLFSAIPVLIVGILFEDQVELIFSRSDSTLIYVGIALLVTATLLFLTGLIKPGKQKNLPFSDAFIIGVAQAMAVIPGLSRSGSTIATGLLLKNNREQVAKFSFLMVLIPIIGASLLKLLEWSGTGTSDTGTASLAAGFIAAYVSGFIACKWMINIVKKGKLIWFAIYCALVGTISILISL